jgi:hypothetical protein
MLQFKVQHQTTLLTLYLPPLNTQNRKLVNLVTRDKDEHELTAGFADTTWYEVNNNQGLKTIVYVQYYASAACAVR